MQNFFSEMPLLGYYGYLPCGALVWVFFIWIDTLYNRDTDLYNQISNKPVNSTPDTPSLASR